MFRRTYKKGKGSKKNNTKTRETLGAKHKECIKKFTTQRTKELPSLKKELKAINKEIKRLETKKKEEKLTGVEHTQLFDYKKKKDKLESKIERIESHYDEDEYFLKTGKILSEYDKSHNHKTKKKKTKSIASDDDDKKSILSFFGGPKPDKNPQKDEQKDKNKITGFFNVSKNTANRAELQDLYLQQIDPNYIPQKEYDENSSVNPNKCTNPDCGAVEQIVLDYTHGRRHCGVCGVELDYFFDPSFNSFKATQSIELTPAFPYKRIAHLQDWLNKIQGKENTDIPKFVFDALDKEFKKYRITDYSTLREDFVKKCLKKLGLNRYYDHIMYIIHQFNGMPPPQLSAELEEKFKKMFMQIQAPFDKHCPPERTNFLSYSYVFHKFCELLELDELIPYFPLLKAREKLFQQDKIWKKICEEPDVRWQYIPSL